MARTRLRLGLLVLAVLVVAQGCAAKQKIPLDCVPETGAIFVDGQPLDEVPAELVLRSDRPHTVFHKGADTEPELIVLKSEDVDGATRLTPGNVCFRPRVVQADRKLTVEIDPAASADAPDDDGEPVNTVDLEPRPQFGSESP